MPILILHFHHQKSSALKGKPTSTEETIWPEIVENIQIPLSACFIWWWFYQYSYERKKNASFSSPPPLPTTSLSLPPPPLLLPLVDSLFSYVFRERLSRYVFDIFASHAGLVDDVTDKPNAWAQHLQTNQVEWTEGRYKLINQNKGRKKRKIPGSEGSMCGSLLTFSRDFTGRAFLSSRRFSTEDGP